MTSNNATSSSAPTDPAPTPITPATFYTCRKCSSQLFVAADLLHPLSSPDACTSHVSAAKATWLQHPSSSIAPPHTCRSVFLTEPPPWTPSAHEGRLTCPKCNARLGSFSWSGATCSCGRWITPAFQFQLSRVDPRHHVSVPAVARVPAVPRRPSTDTQQHTTNTT